MEQKKRRARKRRGLTTPRPPAPGREKDGQKSRLQQQDVPLETKERLPRDGKRKVENKEQRETKDGRDLDDEERGQNGTRAAEKMQERVRRTQPAQRREHEIRFLPELIARRAQELGQRQDTVGAD